MNEPDETTVRRLLAGAERPRELTAAEQARVLARLDRQADQRDPATAPPTPEVVPIDAPRAEVRRRRGALTATLLGTAAAVVLVVALSVRSSPTEPDPAPVASPAPTVASLETGWCRGDLEQVTVGVERWRGVENWAFSFDGLPDLVELTDRALAGLAAVAPDAAEARLDVVRRQLAEDAPDLTVPMEERDVARAREAAVISALTDLVEVGTDVAPECSFDRLVEAAPL